jgi:alkanesulfonate monooxygenase SsuD/methylene tetrahydromethanopterin reductase-like flavin-dependent oxidoreductase (luciferase family)
MEPTIVLATVAASTSYIGLIASASTTYNEPYNIARRFATLGQASGGRVGWNAVTTADAAASRNFGLPAVLEHKARYDRAKDFAEALWDSWEDEAFVSDKATARFVDTSKVHPIVPILQRHGLFRIDYSGPTLRDHFGLARPPSRFARQTPAAASA